LSERRRDSSGRRRASSERRRASSERERNSARRAAHCGKLPDDSSEPHRDFENLGDARGNSSTRCGENSGRFLEYGAVLARSTPCFAKARSASDEYAARFVEAPARFVEHATRCGENSRRSAKSGARSREFSP
jgi:hypothetical protein